MSQARLAEAVLVALLLAGCESGPKTPRPPEFDAMAEAFRAFRGKDKAAVDAADRQFQGAEEALHLKIRELAESKNLAGLQELRKHVKSAYKDAKEGAGLSIYFEDSGHTVAGKTAGLQTRLWVLYKECNSAIKELGGATGPVGEFNARANAFLRRITNGKD